jgi:hypothetical protein
MTKPDLFAALGGWNHVADLDLAVGGDHSVDQKLHQASPLLK